MSRPLRIEFPNAWYHVMNRGASYRNIFSNDTHRMIFVDLLSQITKMFQVEIHGVCLMDNHYHLLIKTPEEQVLQVARGRGKKNIARSAAIFYCRKIAGLPLNEIAKQFGLSHYGSVSGSVAKFYREINENSHLAELVHKIENLVSKWM